MVSLATTTTIGPLSLIPASLLLTTTSMPPSLSSSSSSTLANHNLTLLSSSRLSHLSLPPSLPSSVLTSPSYTHFPPSSPTLSTTSIFRNGTNHNVIINGNNNSNVTLQNGGRNISHNNSGNGSHNHKFHHNHQIASSSNNGTNHTLSYNNNNNTNTSTSTLSSSANSNHHICFHRLCVRQNGKTRHSVHMFALWVKSVEANQNETEQQQSSQWWWISIIFNPLFSVLLFPMWEISSSHHPMDDHIKWDLRSFFYHFPPSPQST